MCASGSPGLPYRTGCVFSFSDTAFTLASVSAAAPVAVSSRASAARARCTAAVRRQQRAPASSCCDRTVP